MTTRKLTLCAFAAIAALVTACSNDELTGNETPQEGIVIKATAGTPEGSANTRLTHTDKTSKMDIVWAVNDKFTAYASAGNKTDYEILAADAGKSSASFTGVWNSAPSAGTIHALYPAGTAIAPAAITLSLENQNGTADGLKDFNYMTASTTYSGTGDLAFGAFSHQVAIVKLVLTFPNDVTATEANNIGLKATGLSKSTVLNLTAGTCSGETAGDVTTGTNTLPIASNQLTAYLCVFPGSLSNAKAIATVGSENYEADLSNLPIVAGNMYTATVTMKKVVTGMQIGDFYMNDGTIVSKNATLTAEDKTKCIGIVIKVGRDAGDNNTYMKKDGVTPMSAIKGYVLALYDADNGNDNFDWGLKVLIGISVNASSTDYFGYKNTQLIKKYAEDNGKVLQTDFPAAYYATTAYEANYHAPDEASGWFFPSLGEIKQWRTNKTILLESIRKVTDNSGYDWMSVYSTSSEMNATTNWYILFESYSLAGHPKSTTGAGAGVRSCLAF